MGGGRGALLVLLVLRNDLPLLLRNAWCAGSSHSHNPLIKRRTWSSLTSTRKPPAACFPQLRTGRVVHRFPQRCRATSQQITSRPKFAAVSHPVPLLLQHHTQSFGCSGEFTAQLPSGCVIWIGLRALLGAIRHAPAYRARSQTPQRSSPPFTRLTHCTFPAHIAPREPIQLFALELIWFAPGVGRNEQLAAEHHLKRCGGI